MEKCGLAIYRGLSFFIFLLITSFAVAQPDYNKLYDASKLTPATRELVQGLETYMASDLRITTERSLPYYLERIGHTANPSDLSVLVLHPDVHLRSAFLADYAIAHQQQEALTAYLKLVVNDSTYLTFYEGCIAWETAFGEHAYGVVSQWMIPADLQQMREQIVLGNDQSYFVERIINELPRDEATYALLHKAVYEQHRFLPLQPLLKYGVAADREAIVSFADEHMAMCHTLMQLYPDPSHLSYIRSFAKQLIEQPDNSCPSFVSLVDQLDSTERSTIFRSMIASFRDDREQAIAVPIYHAQFYRTLPEAEQPAVTLRLLPSLTVVDSIDLARAQLHDPKAFDRAVGFRFHNSKNAFDTRTALLVFQLFAQNDRNLRLSESAYVCGTSTGGELIEAVAVLKEQHPKKAAELLLIRYRAIQNDPQHETRAAILESISYLEDSALCRTLAPEMTQLLLTQHSWETFHYLQIVRTANDPELFERILTHLETQTISYPEIDMIRFFLEQCYETCSTRIVSIFTERGPEAYAENYYREQLKDFLIQYGLVENK